jgi:hypothetical protein
VTICQFEGTQRGVDTASKIMELSTPRDLPGRPCLLTPAELSDLLEPLSAIPDPHHPRGARHTLAVVLALVAYTVLPDPTSLSRSASGSPTPRRTSYNGSGRDWTRSTSSSTDLRRPQSASTARPNRRRRTRQPVLEELTNLRSA